MLIMDSRHPLKDRDRVMIGWFAPQRPADPLPAHQERQAHPQRGAATLAVVRKELAAYGEQVTVQLSPASRRPAWRSSRSLARG